MKERDYVAATELTRVRAALSILRDVTPENAGRVAGVPMERASAEFRHIRHCLDTWAARLELAVGAISLQNEPERREWPRECP